MLCLCGCKLPSQIYACYSVEDGIASNANNVYSFCARANNGAGEVLFGCGSDNLGLVRDQTLTQNYVQNDADAVFFELRATDSVSGVVTSQSAIVPFVDQAVLELSLVLENSCAGKASFPGETCVSGEGRPIEFNRENCLLKFGEDSPKVGEGCDPDPRMIRTCPNPEIDATSE